MVSLKPKLNFIEHNNFDSITKEFSSEINELCFFWKDNFKLNIINNDFLGPSIDSVHQYYTRLTLN